jgi:hypothetical protein
MCRKCWPQSNGLKAFFKKYSKIKFNIISAGTIPSSELNPVVVQVMGELGLICLNNLQNFLSNSMIENSHKIVNMGCMDKELWSINICKRYYKLECF